MNGLDDSFFRDVLASTFKNLAEYDYPLFIDGNYFASDFGYIENPSQTFRYTVAGEICKQLKLNLSADELSNFYLFLDDEPHVIKKHYRVSSINASFIVSIEDLKESADYIKKSDYSDAINKWEASIRINEFHRRIKYLDGHICLLSNWFYNQQLEYICDIGVVLKGLKRYSITHEKTVVTFMCTDICRPPDNSGMSVLHSIPIKFLSQTAS